MNKMKLVLSVTYGALVLAFALWPFDFAACKTCENGASWNGKDGRIEFASPGLVRTSSPADALHRKFVSANGFTIATWLTSHRADQTGPARIVTYSADPFHRNFTLAQENNDLVFRLRTSQANLNGTNPEIVTPDVFIPGSRQHIVMTFDFSDCRVFLDGKQLLNTPLSARNFSSWDPTYHLVFGNENTGDRPWIGSIGSLTLYDRAISAYEVATLYKTPGTHLNGAVASLDFDSDGAKLRLDANAKNAPPNLHRPAVFINNSAREFLTLKPRDTMDFITNFTLFFGFGILLGLTHSRSAGGQTVRIVATTLIAVFFLAIATESLQMFVYSRTSSIADVASCLLGGMLGTLAALIAISRKTTRAHQAHNSQLFK